MRDLIKFELYKIFSKKTVLIVMLASMLFCIIPIITEQVNLRSRGIDSMDEIYEVFEEYEGKPITLEQAQEHMKKRDEYREKIINDEELTKEEYIYYNYSFDMMRNINPIYTVNNNDYTVEQMKDEIKRLEDSNETDSYEYKNLVYIYEIASQKPPQEYYFKQGWMYSTDFNVIATLISSLIAVGLANIFSDEYQSNSASIILSSRNGKTKLILAKIITSIIFTLLMFMFIHALYFINPAINGFRGYDQPINSVGSYEMTPFDMTVIEFYIFGLGVSFIGAILFALTTILISLITKNNVVALGLSLGMYYVPSFISGILPSEGLARIFNEINFAEAVRIQNMCRFTDTYNIFGEPVLYFNLFFTIILISVPIVSVLINYFGRRQTI